MKKSLIALAVAGTFAAPAFAASSNIDFYGKFRVSVDHIDNSIGWQMSDETSRVGFKGAEDLGGGLKAIYQWESGFNMGTISHTVATTGDAGFSSVTSGGTSLGSQRNTFLGLAGDFGTVLFGRHDTPYKLVGSSDLFGDTAADAQNTGGFCIICEDLRVNNAIAYVSPSFSGLTFVGALVVGHGHDTTATTKSQNSLADASSWAVMYNNGPLVLGAAYEDLGHYVSPYSVAGTYSGTAYGTDSQKAYKLNAGYTIDSFKLGATYEKIKDINGLSGVDTSNYLLSAAYGMGPITLAAQYGKRNFNGAANTAGAQDLTDTTLGVVYGLSKRTSTYLGYAHYKLKDGTGVADAKYNVVTVGLNHDF